MIRKLIIILLLFQISILKSQDYDVPFGHITLDSVVITAVKQGLKIDDLIDIMQYDSTLYIAFNNLHFINTELDHELGAFNKKEEEIASKWNKVRQTYDGTCRSQTLIDQKNEGVLKDKKGGDLYYTSTLFERSFLNPKKVCGEKKKNNWNKTVYGSKTDGHLAAIKRVIFNPGTPVDLPLIGNKFALFDPSISKYYDYSIDRKMVHEQECFVFSILVKSKYKESRKDVVVRKLVTAFRRSDFQIIDRDYHLLYKGAIVKMDIAMKVSLQEVGEHFYPGTIQYDGFWKVPTRKAERIKFKTIFDY